MAEKPGTNLCVLKRTRKKPQVGDIFVFQLKPLPECYFFGRVVKIDTKIGNIDNTVLIYIYKSTSPNKLTIPNLELNDLMSAPLGISAQLWLDGYFETVSSNAVEAEHVFKKHCFKSLSRAGVFYDEYGNRLTESFEPCGDWTMGWHLVVDRIASNFAGIRFL